ncbi:MAG: helix-turn-helix transcriptional regulator [Fimbriimonadaceae bacterium]|nr:helix-turn-helix transcriptional regulator [Fimbriimonadaceae bacterium]
MVELLEAELAALGVVAERYQARWEVRLAVCRPDGWLLDGRAPEPAACELRALAVREALRWGEPTFHFAAAEEVLWTVPLLRNQALLGGLVASVAEVQAFGALDLPRAASNLRLLCEEHNLTNAALLEQRRLASGRERLQAEAIHHLKQQPAYNLRQIYLVEEPSLVAAIRRGDRGQARDVLNRLLVGIHHCAGERLELVKSFYLELVVTLSRTAVEAGGAPERLLQANLTAAAKLATVTTEFELAHWLRSALEDALDAVVVSRRQDPQAQLGEALRYLAAHCAEDLTRDQVAAVAHLSPAHFSRQVRCHYGCTFTELLTRARLDRAADLLSSTARPIALIALEAGFSDQSYFTKVFRKAKGVTPGLYRTRSERPAVG